MKNIVSLIGLVVAGLLTFSAQAQVLGSGPKNSFDAQFMKLFGENTAFSAKSDVRVLDKDQKESATLTMNLALLDGNSRNEIDMGNINSKDIPPAAVAQMKSMGMDKVVSVTRKDTKMMYIIYPTMRAAAKMPLPKEQAAALDKEAKMEKTVIGKETIDGHSCVKTKVVITPESGEKREAIVWSATDLKDFPIRIQTQEKDNTVTMTFRDIKLVKPDASLFEIPKGFTEYDDVQKLAMAAMQRMAPPPK